MVIKIGINGFGRISRVVFRACVEADDLEVVAINDPVIEADYICYLIKFDTSHGKFKGTVSNENQEIFVNGKCIKIFNYKQPSTIPWHKANVQCVVEAAGIFTSLEKASEHLSSDGVKRVIVTAPSNDIPMVILGVNEHELKKDTKVISCTSSTLYCLAPLIKILQDNYGVVEGFVTSIHAMTPSLKPIDGLCVRGKHWRDHRSINQNIIPTNTSACKALSRIIPQVKEKLCGIAFRVPVASVSVLDLSIRLSTETNIKDIIQKVKQATDTQKHNVIYLANNNEVSSDFIGENHSCILDVSTSIGLNANLFKLVCWYENEYSYACRVIDTIKYLEIQTTPTIVRQKLKVPIKICSERKRVNSATECEEQKLKKATTFPVFFKKLSHKQQRSIPSSAKKSRKKTDSADTISVNDKPVQGESYQDDGSDINNLAKHHDRLQKLKDEFRKMVNKTEDLLKKSYNNRFRSHSVAASVIDVAEEENINKDIIENANNVENLNNLGNGDNSDFHTESSVDLYHSVVTNGNLPTTQKDKDNIIDNREVVIKMADTNIVVIEEVTKTDTESKIENKITSTDQNLTSIHCKSSRKSTEQLENKSTLTKETSGYIENRSTILEILFDDSREIIPQKVNSNIGKSNNNLSDEKLDEIDVDSKVLEKYKKQIDIKKVDGKIEISFKEPPSKSNPLTYDKVLARRKKKVTPKLKAGNIKKDLSHNLSQDTKSNAVTTKRRIPLLVSKVRKAKTRSDDIFRGNRRVITASDSSFETIPGISQGTSIELVKDFDQAISCNEKEMNVHDYENITGVVDCSSITDLSPSFSKFRSYPPIMAEQLLKFEANKKPQCKAQGLLLQPYNPINYSEDREDKTGMIFKTNVVPKYNMDIYDKLESTSSANSFNPTEQKSQIISVSDLTNSLHDLQRLNKICKIIEISDDLSDKLFSPLNETAQPSTDKKWCFKDLCERIKLDEFFENVFGKSVS